jgi:hypothetical protein
MEISIAYDSVLWQVMVLWRLLPVLRTPVLMSQAGEHNVELKPFSLSSGTYLWHLSLNGFMTSYGLVILK